MSDPNKVVPLGVPDSPPFADAGYVHLRGDILTLLFMRTTYGAGQASLAAPVVASVTMTLEGARAVLNLIKGVLPEYQELKKL